MGENIGITQVQGKVLNRCKNYVINILVGD